jgi:hypothetical protein
MLIGLLSLSYSRVFAEPPQKPKPTPISHVTIYQIQFQPGYAKTLCIGQTTTLNAKFGTTGSEIAALEDVSRIDFESNRSTVDPIPHTPGINSGVVSSTFYAYIEGTSTITAKLYSINPLTKQEELDATSAPIYIKVVKDCSYYWRIQAEMNVKTKPGSSVLGIKWILSGHGGLKPLDPEQPLEFKGSGNSPIRLEISDEYFSGDCVILSQSGGALGFLDATATITDKGTMLDVKIGPPQSFDWFYTSLSQCRDEPPGTVNTRGTLTSSKDPWLEVKFPVDGGTVPIKPDILETGVHNFVDTGGSGSYTATMTVERVSSD